MFMIHKGRETSKRWIAVTCGESYTHCPVVPPCRQTAPGPGLDGSLVLEISCIRLLLHSQTFAEPLLCVMLKELGPKLGVNKADFKK